MYYINRVFLIILGAFLVSIFYFLTPKPCVSQSAKYCPGRCLTVKNCWEGCACIKSGSPNDKDELPYMGYCASVDF